MDAKRNLYSIAGIRRRHENCKFRQRAEGSSIARERLNPASLHVAECFVLAARPGPALSDFPFHTREKLRYGDTDRQGHVNNAVFATFFETGRVDMLINGGIDLMGPNQALCWPGCCWITAVR